MPRARRIRTRFSWKRAFLHGGLFLGGELKGKASYLAIYEYDAYPDRMTQDLMATLKGQRLYRLAKAIVRQFEEPHDD